ncbi:MAG: toxin [Candidatus Brocadia sp. UTAMX2]|jgi:RHS repeat-associated protein|nr:MAG: toxin [Candidatus Brocadia sp. UTAMX2]
MPKEQQKPSDTKEPSQDKGPFSAPAIQLPKGGGAIRGIGEKFAANPVTGTGSMTVPIATSPGRSGFGPQLSLSYDSGAGNGPFGFGWSLSLPSITRKTDKGLPKYQDAEESDVFILSGAEDLVPVLKEVNGKWERETLPPRTVDGKTYRIQRYRPRIEGLFARIERWTNQNDLTDTFWRSISKDNITTWYGKTAESRIADPANPTRIFSWLICESYDDKGNVIVYRYKEETSDNIDLAQAHERNRTDNINEKDKSNRTANRYLKRILYGNRLPYLPGLTPTGWPQPPDSTAGVNPPNYFFEVVFDYEDGHYIEDNPDTEGRIFARPVYSPPQNAKWPARVDPFSTYRAGFEVRTYRLCQRVLMFHHFPDELGTPDYLVRSTDFTYSYENNPGDSRNPVYSFLDSVSQSGYVRQPNGTYLKKSLPPLEFEYTRPEVQTEVREVDPQSLENLPYGLDGAKYQWVDLDGEGLSGILTEQAEGWFYKRNLSPINLVRDNGNEHTEANFAPVELVARKPSLAAISSGQQQFLDLAGDGQLDLVALNGPTPGFYERTQDESWEYFRPFVSFPNLEWGNQNLKFVDLTGDGHADILIAEDDAFTWYRSLAEEGFGPAEKVRQALDEEKGPRLVFADGTQSIYLSDISGDGLSDLVRIRNGEVCYWPNLGYGRFGAKVTMDRSPWFDRPDQFDPRRIQLADIDGTGTTDIIYIGQAGVDLYFNQSGNSWSNPYRLGVFPQTNNLTSVTAMDLLGNGTACLVWSSPLPGDASRPMRYIDLMGSQKPHLLIKSVNNLGAETHVHYAPSTRFYVADKIAGRPWITRIPFPVHVVERVETYDHISRNRFVTRYAYHHGYFDGEEREFRGFGMVEQFDTEEFTALSAGDSLAPLAGEGWGEGAATNIDAASHVPPVLTKTWFHTGVYDEVEEVSQHFAAEYYGAPKKSDPNYDAAFDAFFQTLLPDTILPSDLTLDEEREACRALKGSMLRQEVYARDGTEKEQHPYTVTEQNFTIKRLLPRAGNRHGVFFTHAREAISYHYERNPADPRIQHALTLEVDAFGNVLKQAAIGYGRRVSPLSTQWDRDRQTTPLLTYTENDVTNAIELADTHRNPLPCEAITFELTGYTATGAAGRFQASDFVEPDPTAAGRLRHKFAVPEVAYEATATGSQRRRPIEWLRTLYRRDNLDGLLPLGDLQPLALPGESYKLAFTPGLLAQVFQRPRQGQATEPLLPDPAAVLGGQDGNRGGYLRSQTMKADGRFPATDAEDHWWIPSGQSFFTNDPLNAAATELAQARQHFFLPQRYRDPFGQDAFVDFDTNDLLMTETRDALGNRVTVNVNNYRVLQPRLVSDPNRNRTEVAFDTLGMVVGTAVMGKPLPAPVEGDTLTGFVADFTQAQLDGFFDAADPHATAAALLKDATTRIIYDLDRFWRSRDANPDKPDKWEAPFAATLARETHVSSPLPPQGLKFQLSFSYSDGFGREIQKKIQAEKGKVPMRDGNGRILLGPDNQPVVSVNEVAPRWVGSGWTIFNNKSKPVRQFEPFFSDTHKPDFDTKIGVSPVLFYDPAERVIATLHPNHTYEKVVFDPWQQTTYDVNDTCAPRNQQTGDPRTDPDIGGYVAEYFKTQPATWQTWHAQCVGGTMGTHERDAAQRAAAHVDTPTTAHFDALGRPFLTVARNRVVCPGHDLDGTEDSFATRVELDIEGNQREVRDERKLPVNYLSTGAIEQRIVMRYAYDMLGNRIHQFSMEAGARWLLNDVDGKPIRAWDTRGHNFTTTYDALRRPIEQYLRGTFSDPDPLKPNSDPRTLNPPSEAGLLVDKIEYGEGIVNAERLNLRTRIYQHFDSTGVATNARLDANGNPTEAYDFKGNLWYSTRRLAKLYKDIPDWSQDADPQLDAETFEGSTHYDALNRPIQSIAPHSNLARAKRHVIQPVFNEANLLERVDVWLEQAAEPDTLLDPNTEPASPVGVANIDYDAKGQRLRIDYMNGASTFYSYDPLTFRLTQLLTRRNAASFPSDDPQPLIAGWPGRQVQNLYYTYDPAGNITHIQDDAQQTIYFKNKRVEPSNDYVYDALYRLIQASGREHLGQLASGEPRPPTAPDGFNAFHTRLDHPGNGQAMGTYIERYVYDAVGNFLQMQHRGGDPAHAGWTRRYTYNETSLIEGSKQSNRLSSTQVGNGVAAVPEPYLHDAHGSMVRMPHLGGGLPGPNMHWDYKDQLRQTDLDGGGAAYYVYDASGQRVRKVWEKAPGLTEERIYLGGCEIFRRHNGPIGANTTSLERETLHVMDDKQRIALVETRTLDTAGNDSAPRQLIRYQFGNHLGSASLELDEQAQIISYEEYAPYGSSTYQAVRSQTETSKRYRYTGKERDEESGLYYHGARYYAPWLGRWTSCDPKGLSDGINCYRYSHDRPIVLIDRDGTQSEKPTEESSKASNEEINQLERTRKDLEKKYGITIEKGDKDWSVSDLEDLKWALSQLTKKEVAALKDYRFLRWQDRESRLAADPSYDPKGEEEAGMHEPDIKGNLFKISLYDKAFDKATTYQLEIGGKPVGKAQLQSRIDMLHEIGHAMATADYRKAWNKYSPVQDAYNKLVDEYNAASGANEKQALHLKVKKLEKTLDRLEKRLTDAEPKGNQDRAEAEFEKLAKDMTPVTEYAGTSAREGFAETFAMYKLNAKGIEKMKLDLAAWFKRQAYLKEE